MNVLVVVPWDQEFGGVASVVGKLVKYLTRCGDSAYLTVQQRFTPETMGCRHQCLFKYLLDAA
jgi:hypothetical protein